MAYERERAREGGSLVLPGGPAPHIRQVELVDYRLILLLKLLEHCDHSRGFYLLMLSLRNL